MQSYENSLPFNNSRPFDTKSPCGTSPLGVRCLDPEEEFEGSDLSIHKIGATPEREAGW